MGAEWGFFACLARQERVGLPSRPAFASDMSVGADRRGVVRLHGDRGLVLALRPAHVPQALDAPSERVWRGRSAGWRRVAAEGLLRGGGPGEPDRLRTSWSSFVASVWTGMCSYGAAGPSRWTREEPDAVGCGGLRGRDGGSSPPQATRAMPMADARDNASSRPGPRTRVSDLGVRARSSEPDFEYRTSDHGTRIPTSGLRFRAPVPKSALRRPPLRSWLPIPSLETATATPTATASPTPTPTSTAAPTPAPVPDRSHALLPGAPFASAPRLRRRRRLRVRIRRRGQPRPRLQVHPVRVRKVRRAFDRVRRVPPFRPRHVVAHLRACRRCR